MQHALQHRPALVLLALAALTTSSCHILGFAGEPCTLDTDCRPDERCDAALAACSVGPRGEGEGAASEGEGAEGEGAEGEGDGEGEGAEGEGAGGGEGDGEGAGEGEGEGAGEGEGTAGEGEGTAGEGEGTAGEGEGAAGEGEGAAGEGEGEGTAGEGEGAAGEGEGEGVGPARIVGDPFFLGLELNGACAAFSDTIYFHVSPPSTDLGDCSVTLRNQQTRPIEVDDVNLAGDANFTFSSVSPALPVTLVNGDSIIVHFEGKSPPSGPADAVLSIVGSRTEHIPVAVDVERTGGAFPIVRGAGECKANGELAGPIFRGVDPADGNACVAAVINVGDQELDYGDFASQPGSPFVVDDSNVPFQQPSHFIGTFVVGAKAGTFSGLNTGVTGWPTSIGQLNVNLQATYSPMAIAAVTSPDCTVSAGPDIAICSFPAMARSSSSTIVVGLTNTGVTDAFIDSVQPASAANVTFDVDELLPFLLSPGDTRDLPLRATSSNTTGAFNVDVELVRTSPSTNNPRSIAELRVSGDVQ